MPTQHSIPTNLCSFLFYFMKKQRWWFIAIAVTGLGWTFDFTVWPYIWKHMIDQLTVLGEERASMWHHLMPLLIAALCFWLSIEFLFRSGGFLMARALPVIQAHIRMEMLSAIQHHSHHYFSEHFAGDIANKVGDMASSITQIIQMILTMFIPVLVAFFLATTMFTLLQPFFGAVLFIWLLIHSGICIYCSRKCNYLSEAHATIRSDLSGRLVDSITNMSNVTVFARRRYEQRYLGFYQDQEQRSHQHSLYYIEKVKIYLGIASLLIPGIILTLSMLYAWQQQMITLGEVVYINGTTWGIMMMAWIAGLQLPLLFKEIGVCNQALKLIQTPFDITEKDNAPSLRVTKGEIVFDKVSFSYHDRQLLFDEKTITIKGGEKVGLVGFSGSGKTTFVNLILRFYDVRKGNILIDGTSIADVSLDSLRQNIALIPQDPVLFHRSLADNIRYGKEDATDEEVIAASKQAHCHEFITSMSEGYNVIVGERGIKLSGGQRQRIAIARAILKNAPILILDEATSALDSVTERKIQEALQTLMKKCTTIVVAHRLSTLAMMDRILVFDQGRVIEEGTHTKLITIPNGHYAKMWRMQADGFLSDQHDKL